jgi:hypothetical protein
MDDVGVGRGVTATCWESACWESARWETAGGADFVGFACFVAVDAFGSFARFEVLPVGVAFPLRGAAGEDDAGAGEDVVTPSEVSVVISPPSGQF